LENYNFFLSGDTYRHGRQNLSGRYAIKSIKIFRRHSDWPGHLEEDGVYCQIDSQRRFRFGRKSCRPIGKTSGRRSPHPTEHVLRDDDRLRRVSRCTRSSHTRTGRVPRARDSSVHKLRVREKRFSRQQNCCGIRSANDAHASIIK